LKGVLFMEGLASKELIRLFPKVDLHVHLDGSVNPDTLIELAKRQGMKLPAVDAEGLRPFMQVDDRCDDLKEYLRTFDFVLPFLQEGWALERVAEEVTRQAAMQQCQYIEVRFAPQLHRRKGLQVDEVIHHVLRGLAEGERKYGIVARGIAICLRSHTLEENIAVVEAAGGFLKLGLVAVDLAGDEASYPPELFREVFALSRRKGIPVTIHAGEAAGAENVYEAVANLGAVRVGHGVRLMEKPELLEWVKQQRIPLEMCPVSNIQTKAVRSWDAYPVRDYFELGLLVTINTDNPIVSGTSITKEYEVLYERFGFQLKELVALVRNGVEAAFLPDREKESLRLIMQARFKELGLRF
jgi:adenosine deaminase